MTDQSRYLSMCGAAISSATKLDWLAARSIRRVAKRESASGVAQLADESRVRAVVFLLRALET